jgi:hypothetical protein
MTCQRLQPNLPSQLVGLVRLPTFQWPRSRRLLVLCPRGCIDLWTGCALASALGSASEPRECRSSVCNTRVDAWAHVDARAHVRAHPSVCGFEPAPQAVQQRIAERSPRTAAQQPIGSLCCSMQSREGLLAVCYRCMCSHMGSLHVDVCFRFALACASFVACGTQCAWCLYASAHRTPSYIRYVTDKIQPLTRRSRTERACAVDVFHRTRSRAADLMYAVPLSAARSCGVRWRSLSRMA